MAPTDNYWSSNVDTDGNTDENWSLGHVPTTGETAIIDGTGSADCIFSGSISCGALSHTAGVMSPGGQVLGFSGDVSIGGSAEITGAGLNSCTINVGGDFICLGVDLVGTAAWYLNITGDGLARDVRAAYCNASGSTDEIQCVGCLDDGNNSNWAFPEGSLLKPMEWLRISLAQSATFRTWTSTSSQQAALAKVYLEGLPHPADGLEYTVAEIQGYRPYALIYMAESLGLIKQRDSYGAGFEFGKESGQLKLLLTENVSDAVGHEPSSKANLTFKRTVGKIIDELGVLFGQGENLAGTGITLEQGPYWPHEDRIPGEGLFVAVVLAINWGSD
jgi:hypothetical protein